MNTDNIYENASTVPTNINMSIYSNGKTKHYNLTGEQNIIYEKLKDINRSNYFASFISSFFGFTLSILCIVLLFFHNTRKYAFYSLCIILILWFSYVKYLTYEGNKNKDKIDALLNSFKV